MKAYRPIIEALEKIAKGDFRVNIENKYDRPESHMLGELVDSVNKMAVELNQIETMRQEFISNVSHEIQTPLTSIRGFAQALNSDALSEEDREHYLTIIEAESMRLSKLSDNLLKLASLEAEQVKFEAKPYRLDRQVRNLILACEPQWLEKTLDMEVCLEEVTITADEDLLSQVWLNLLHNSIKFTPPGGRITIRLNRCEDLIKYQISDTGTGISQEDLAHIFERFYKADKSRTGLTGGSGLGLAITRKIVELHRGTIAVESQPGAGTTFSVSLPT
jgi:signal transduction histidine kinase